MLRTINDWIRLGMLRRRGVERLTLEAAKEAAQENLDEEFFWLTRLRFHISINDRCIRLAPLLQDLFAARYRRLILGMYRYEQYTGWNPAYRVVASAMQHLTEYLETGNREHLVDARNLVEIEWIRGGGHSSSVNDVPPTIDAARAALEIYEQTGARGELVAAAIAVETEWLEPTHAHAHWAPGDDTRHTAT